MLICQIRTRVYQEAKVTTIFLSGCGGGGCAGIFIELVVFFSEPSSVKIYFTHEKESKKFASYHVEQKYIFS
jgi:hypothetical protein